MNSTIAKPSVPTASLTFFERTASFLTLLFAVSVFVWKPGIYAASGLIIVYLVIRALLDVGYRQAVWQNRLTKVTLAMFALGLLTSAISANQFEDFSWMARKTMFLPVIVFFTFALTHQRNKNIAMTGLIASFWIASLITLSRYGWQMNFGGRMEGIWPQGTWDNLLGLFLCFLVLYAKWANSTVTIRIIYIATMLMALLMVLLAGGRGPWLALAVSLAVYFLVFKRATKVLVTAALVGVIAVIASTTIFYDKTRGFLDRVASINDPQEGSRWVRVQLWQIGIAHMSELIKTEPFKAVFGSGSKSYNQTQIDFFETLPYDEEAKAALQEYGYPSGDTHNNYIDSALRNGLLWTAAIFLYLIWLGTRCSVETVRKMPEPSILLLYFYIMAMVYTVVPHFMSFFFALFITMLLAPDET